MVAIRRRATVHDPDRRSLFTVAASYPEATCIPPGTQVRIGEGEIGFAADVQRVMSRSDYRGLTAPERLELGTSTLPGIRPDLVAPLVFEEDTVAVVAIEGLRRWRAGVR